jgi:hypothetical protein
MRVARDAHGAAFEGGAPCVTLASEAKLEAADYFGAPLTKRARDQSPTIAPIADRT